MATYYQKIIKDSTLTDLSVTAIEGTSDSDYYDNIITLDEKSSFVKGDIYYLKGNNIKEKESDNSVNPIFLTIYLSSQALRDKQDSSYWQQIGSYTLLNNQPSTFDLVFIPEENDFNEILFHIKRINNIDGNINIDDNKTPRGRILNISSENVSCKKYDSNETIETSISRLGIQGKNESFFVLNNEEPLRIGKNGIFELNTADFDGYSLTSVKILNTDSSNKFIIDYQS